MASTMMAQDEVQDYGCNTRNGIAAHYDANSFRFPSPGGLGCILSSEYHDDTLGLVYYRERERTFHGHYRHYNPIDGRWISRDPMENLHHYRYPLCC